MAGTDTGSEARTTRPSRWLRAPRATLVWARRAARKVLVSGSSMYPMLLPGDTVIFDRLAFRHESPRRGDIVLVRAPSPPGGLWIKLVVGLPGEQVAVAQDRLWIDGRAVRFPQPVVGSLPGSWDVPAASYFLLSYAVAVGTDSRQVGPLPGRAIRGRAWRIAAPAARRRAILPLLLELDNGE